MDRPEKAVLNSLKSGAGSFGSGWWPTWCGFLENRELIHPKSGHLLKYLTLRKAVNFAMIKWEKKRRATVVHGYPYNIIIDPTNRCNLRCPLCRTGSKRNRRDPGAMSFETFRRILAPLAPHAIRLLLYNWGEPLLNREIYQMIAHAGRAGMATSLSSNLSIAGREDLEQIVACGLDHLIVSLDGASQSTYSAYRVGGEFETVFDNIKRLVEIKRRRRCRHPLIEWQFLVMRHNEHEIPAVRKMADRVGVDWLTLGKIGFGEAPYDGSCDPALMNAWLPVHHPEHRHAYDGGVLFDGPCLFLWESVTINWDGGVSPCCVLDDPADDFGNALEEPFEKIWNNARYRTARSLFKQNVDGKTVAAIPCRRCKLFRKG